MKRIKQDYESPTSGTIRFLVESPILTASAESASGEGVIQDATFESWGEY